MKWVRVLSRLALLCVVAAAFVGLTTIYGRSAQLPLPNPLWQEGRDHRASAPEIGYFSEFVGEILLLAVVAVAGRVVLRLRLNSVSRNEGQTILLNLHRAREN